MPTCSPDTAARVRCARGQERRDLAAEYLVLQLYEERFGLGQGQAQMLQLLVVFGQHDELVDGHLLVIIGDDHELELELQRHTGGPLRRKIQPRYPARSSQPDTNGPPFSHTSVHRVMRRFLDRRRTCS